MGAAPLPYGEPERLAALEEYGVVDTLPEQVFDDLTFLAAKICGAPIALVSLVDRDRQWFKSRVGLDATETPRSMAFCAHAILEPEELLVVADATADARFCDNPLVTAAPDIRFYAGAPLVTPDGHALGTLCVIDREPRALSEDQHQALSALARQATGQLELRRSLASLQRSRTQLEEANAALAVRSRTDALTALANRGAFDERLADELRRTRRLQLPLGLLLLDVDHFKSYNDTFGHPAGDEVLRSIGRHLRSQARAADLAARFGGEEFAVVLPGSDLDGACLVAERIRGAIEGAPDANRPVTVSVGVTTAREGDQPSDLILRADAALYAAKRGGRNRVHAG